MDDSENVITDRLESNEKKFRESLSELKNRLKDFEYSEHHILEEAIDQVYFVINSLGMCVDDIKDEMRARSLNEGTRAPSALKFDVWSCIHYYDQRQNRTNIEATLRVDNVNDHGTTIKEIQINSKTPHIESIQSYKKLVSIPSHATTQFRVSWMLPGVKLEDSDLHMSLIISTTHSMGIIVPVVSMLSEIDSLTESENV